MARYETGARDSTDFFRWRAEWQDGEDVSGEYRSTKNVEAGIRYDRKIQEMYYPERHVTYAIQKLVAVYAYPPYLEWKDLDDIYEY